MGRIIHRKIRPICIPRCKGEAWRSILSLKLGVKEKSSSAFLLANCPTARIPSKIGGFNHTQLRAPLASISARYDVSKDSSLSPPHLEEKRVGGGRGGGGHIARRVVVGFSLFGPLITALLVKDAAVAAEAAPCELTVAPSGLAFCDRVLGTGVEAGKGQLIKAHYVGKLENGRIFDSSYNRGKPLTFRVGVGEVIKGWDQGILGGDGIPPMLAGGKRTLKLPPELGYGARGAGCKGGSCVIPPDSVLLFDVEFVGKA